MQNTCRFSQYFLKFIKSSLVLSCLAISEMFLDLSYLNIPITHNATSVRREILPVCFPVTYCVICVSKSLNPLELTLCLPIGWSEFTHVTVSRNAMQS